MTHLAPEIQESVQDMDETLRIFREKYEPSYERWGMTEQQLQELQTAHAALKRFLAYGKGTEE